MRSEPKAEIKCLNGRSSDIKKVSLDLDSKAVVMEVDIR